MTFRNNQKPLKIVIVILSFSRIDMFIGFENNEQEDKWLDNIN